MSIKDIIVYLDNDRDCENRLEFASRLCERFGAQLTGLYLLRKMPIPAWESAYMPLEVFEADDAQSQKLRDEAQSVFTANTATADFDAHFNSVDNDVSITLNQYSRYTDLLVIPRRNDNQSDLNPWYQVSDILLGAACPVLVVPDNKPDEMAPETALLAWNGKRECARAIKAAMPMLSQVKKIDIVSVNCEEREAKQIALHIGRHGIETRVHQLESNRQVVASVLLEQAARLESQMIIMGAYGHSRIRELILGGTTKHILEQAELPVLFSH